MDTVPNSEFQRQFLARINLNVSIDPTGLAGAESPGKMAE